MSAGKSSAAVDSARLAVLRDLHIALRLLWGRGRLTCRCAGGRPVSRVRQWARPGAGART